MSKSIPIIIVDSREQRPYFFTEGRADTIVKALPAGDYSLQNYETKIAIERKSLNDFVNTVVHAQDRFARELSILRSYPRAWIIVEASMQDILAGNYQSEVQPNALFAMAASIQAIYNIEIQFCGDRETARAWTEEVLIQYWKSQQRKS